MLELSPRYQIQRDARLAALDTSAARAYRAMDVGPTPGSGSPKPVIAYLYLPGNVLPLEHLVARPPQVLLSVGAEDSSDRMLRHPVLAGLLQAIAVRRYPERLLHCGGPTIIDAVGHLARIRRAL